MIDATPEQPIEIVGVNRFIMVYRIDDLMDYSKNHYEILDPFFPDRLEKIAWELGTIATRPTVRLCGGMNGTVADYNFFVYDRELKLNPVTPIFVPENTQFIIMLNKEIPWNPYTFRIINERVNRYTILRTEKFIEATMGGLYQNINYQDFEYDPLQIFIDSDIQTFLDDVFRSYKDKSSTFAFRAKFASSPSESGPAT